MDVQERNSPKMGECVNKCPRKVLWSDLSAALCGDDNSVVSGRTEDVVINSQPWSRSGMDNEEVGNTLSMWES